ncbi:MAG: hypothetical protein M3401_07630 [Actinomycetota bacterium]|nr:hypothetical protein [Actinomycetota bacterium]
MARHERSRQPLSSEPLDGKVRIQVRRGADGKMEIVAPETKLTPTTEPAERPPHPGDPRPFADHGGYGV